MILLNENTKCLVQGITGKQGSFHTEQMLKYNTNIAAGITPGKGGQDFLGVPVFNSIEEAKDEYQKLIEEQKEEDKKALFEAFKKSRRSLEEVLDFLKEKAARRHQNRVFSARNH